MDKVKEMGLWDDTMIVVTSDNGPTPTANGDAFGQTMPLRGIKGTVYLVFVDCLC